MLKAVFKPLLKIGIMVFAAWLMLGAGKYMFRAAADLKEQHAAEQNAAVQELIGDKKGTGK